MNTHVTAYDFFFCLCVEDCVYNPIWDIQRCLCDDAASKTTQTCCITHLRCCWKCTWLLFAHVVMRWSCMWHTEMSWRPLDTHTLSLSHARNHFPFAWRRRRKRKKKGFQRRVFHCLLIILQRKTWSAGRDTSAKQMKICNSWALIKRQLQETQ